MILHDFTRFLHDSTRFYTVSRRFAEFRGVSRSFAALRNVSRHRPITSVLGFLAPPVYRGMDRLCTTGGHLRNMERANRPAPNSECSRVASVRHRMDQVDSPIHRQQYSAVHLFACGCPTHTPNRRCRPRPHRPPCRMSAPPEITILWKNGFSLPACKLS